MKKSIFLFLLLALGSFSVVYYYWKQATQLPEWYVTKEKTTNPQVRQIDFRNEAEVQTVKARLQRNVDAKIENSIGASQGLQTELSRRDGSDKKPAVDKITENPQAELGTQNIEIDLSEHEVNDLVISTIAKDKNTSKLLASTKGLNTTIKNGQVESGVVFNVSEVPKEELNQQEKELLEKVIKTFPFLEEKEVYIGVEGKPRVENGQLKLEEQTKIKVGNLSFTTAELSQRLGIPQEKIEQRLKLELELGRLKINDIEIKENNASLKGSVN
ncbi:hypothetical protein H6F50_11365 [Coleofasciculus sp. FACHB-712]|uniref:hypothetical protein n=1 Tax=Coleofasciculus sp. FACHB-712 TaxID=2692789 RepID=UPI001684D0C0|nr:hypothetical protein [Coleofasciculus sp. FACHB-712]MBD1942951.1 hypothetical protein [Coleofasciculus sp. FACHB-712]